VHTVCKIDRGLLGTKLTIKMDEETADKLLNRPHEKLNGKSFKETFIDSLKQAKENISGNMPRLIFMTGGVSKMQRVRTWCGDIFPDAVVITGSEPEFSVARGLSYCGKIDDDLKRFKEEIDRLISSSDVEQLVESHIEELYKSTMEAMIDPILEDVALPVVERWRTGEIEKLADIDKIMEKEIEKYLHTDDARKYMMHPVTSWLRKIAYALEEYTIPICAKYNVPYSALSLNSYFSLTDFNIKLDSKDIFALDEITLLIDTVISLIVGFLSGGSGIAMISSGPAGVFAGAIISRLVLALGRNKIQGAILNANVPLIMRKMFGKNYFKSRMNKLSVEVKASLYKNMDEGKMDDMQKRLTDEISHQIESCLYKMAQVVEIPLG
jgi:hypothetical protein